MEKTYFSPNSMIEDVWSLKYCQDFISPRSSPSFITVCETEAVLGLGSLPVEIQVLLSVDVQTEVDFYLNPKCISKREKTLSCFILYFCMVVVCGVILWYIGRYLRWDVRQCRVVCLAPCWLVVLDLDLARPWDSTALWAPCPCTSRPHVPVWQRISCLDSVWSAARRA